MTAADCIRNVRIEMGLSQAEFAILIKKDPTSVSMYESGKRKPGFPTIRKIVEEAKKKGIKVKYTDLHDS